MRILFSVIVILASLGASPAFAVSGSRIYAQRCAKCHNFLSPKLGDRAAWAPRIKLGRRALVNAAIHGIGTMPPRGGNPSLSDSDIKAAVTYMMSRVK